MSPAATSLPNIRGSMQEVLFAQRLADNEKKNRDRALKKFKTFLAVKSSNGPGFTDDDGIKVWKGLFYCMYMADKPLVQEQVAEDISCLIHDLGNLQDRRTFTTSAFRTFAREWDGIDIFRMDKFMMFIRRVLRQVFVHLKLQNWNLKEVAKYVGILDTWIIRADDNTNSTPLGIKLHLCYIVMEELAKIGGEELSHETIMAVIQPYLKVLAISKIKEYRQKVSEEIIRHLMRQSEIGVAYEEDATGILQGRMNVDEEEEEAAEEEEEEEATEEIPLEEAVLDPRAGDVNVYIPQLCPDFSLLAEALQRLGSINKVSEVNRKLIYAMVRECQDMAEGVYPLTIPGLEDEPTNDWEEEEEEEKQAVERLQEFYSNLGKISSKADIKKLGDLKQDVLKNYSIEQRKRRNRKSLKQKKKLKRLEKKVFTFKQKKEIAKQQSAAELNRKKAVENQVCQIAKVVDLPATANTVKRKKEAEGDNKKTKKQRKQKKAAGFEVSAITPPNGENKSDLSSSVVNNFEVSAIPKKGKSGRKRKNLQKSGESPKKMKSSEGTEIASVSVPKILEVKASKGMEIDSVSVPKVPEVKSSKGMEITPVSVPNLPEKLKGKKKKKKKASTNGNKADNASSAKKESGGNNVQSPQKEIGIATEASKESAHIQVYKTKNTKNNKSFDVADFSKQTEILSIQKSEQKTGCDKDVKTKASLGGSVKTKTKASPKAKVENNIEVIANAKVDKTVVSPGNIQKTPDLKPAKKTPVGKDKGLVINFSEKSKSVWSEPLKEHDIEIFLKDRRQAKLEKKRRASLSTPKGTPKTPREKTIKINLKQNKEHDFKDYVHSIRNSPQIPFSADKLPKAPVLKPSPSPILIKKPALKILKNVLRKSSPSASYASPSLPKKSPKAKKLKRSNASDFF